jgi:hypothetical protein
MAKYTDRMRYTAAVAAEAATEGKRVPLTRNATAMIAMLTRKVAIAA